MRTVAGPTFAALLAATLLLGASVALPGPPDAVPVSVPRAPGATQRFELALGASQSHPLMLQAGQFVEVELREKGPRIVLTLLDPAGATLARREALADTITSFRFMAIAAASGTHVLDVRSSGEGRPGTYEIRMEEPRYATERERALVAADDALAKAVRLSNESTAESLRGALGHLEVAKAGFEEAGDRLGQALALLQRGRLQVDSGQAAASDSLEQSISVFRALGNREGEGAALLGLGFAKRRKGEIEAARLLFEASTGLARAIDGRWMLYAGIRGIGLTFFLAGQAERAVELFTESLSLATEAGSRRGQSNALQNLGNAYNYLGDRRKALECYQRSLSLSRAQSRGDDVAAALGSMASLHIELGEVERALAFLEEALPLAQASGQPFVEANVLNNMAKALSRLGDHERALELGGRSLQLRRQIRDRLGEAATLHSLGRNLHRFGDMEGALRHLGEALAIRQATRQQQAEAWTLAAMAAVERDRGNLRAALARAEAAITLTEALRSAVTNPDMRASFVAAEQDRYDVFIDVLMRLHEQDPTAGHDAAALQVSERARARVLLEALMEARADIRQGIEPPLLERERSLQKEMNESSARLSRALSREGADEEVRRARHELDGKSDEYRRVQSRIRQESPGYAALTQPVPATVEQIRGEVLDDDTVLLEFYLGSERSFLWGLTRSTLVSHALPGQAPIEAAARRVHDLLTERQRTRTLAVVRDADRRLKAEMAALSRILLKDVAPRLATDWKGKRLLVVASGALAFLPFGALPSSGEAGARPLVLDHEIVSAPSASVLLTLRQEHAPRGPSRTTVAVLADPVFEAGDPRVRRRPRGPQPLPVAPTGLTRAMESLGRERLTRLPFSRGEAETIAAFVPRASLLMATDFAAARRLVVEGELGDRRIVHIATHGLLDGEHPDLSGLVLSLVDEKGAPRDGFLRMHEIYNLRLPADLVVLSACQTALGREIRGEGLVGLTRGFMYAGAQRVVASLWQVDDESTAELMQRFYRAMLKDDRRPAEALRVAQIEMSQDRRWSAPFYWAGFVLQGEWR